MSGGTTGGLEGIKSAVVSFYKNLICCTQSVYCGLLSATITLNLEFPELHYVAIAVFVSRRDHIELD